jgi:hypothetical protein
MRQERGLSHGYTRQTCEAVRVALRHARSEGVLPKGYEVPQIAWPKQRRAKVDVYSREDLELIIATRATSRSACSSSCSPTPPCGSASARA